MSVRLKTQYAPNTIPVRDMRDGQIGIVRECLVREYIGRIVQCYGSALVSIGLPAGKGWQPKPGLDSFRVEILKDGTDIVVEDNQ